MLQAIWALGEPDMGRASCVPAQEMAQRMRVAVEARDAGELLIIALTDARRSEGMFDFHEMSRLLGMGDVIAFQKRHNAL